MLGQVGTGKDHWWVYLFGVFIVVRLVCVFNQNNLDKILLGDDIAISLGTPVGRLRVFVIVSVCILTSISVAIAGLVGFVGLVAPHVGYLLLKTRRHKWTLGLSSLLGANLFLISDILARHFSKDVPLPSGSVMAIIGAPMLIFLLIKRDHAHSR